MNSAISRTLAGAAVTAAAVGAALVAAVPAHAVDGGLNVSYDAVGSTFVAMPKSTVALGPTTLSTVLNPVDGSFTGQLPIPPTTSTFKVLGFLPVKANVSFIPAGDVTGKLTTTGTKQSVAATAKYTIRLSNVTLGGLPAFVGNSCQTSAPAVIPVGTPANGSFNITTGGVVGGTYTIGKFANCGLTTGIVNLLVPGAGNTVSFTLSNGRITS